MWCSDCRNALPELWGLKPYFENGVITYEPDLEGQRVTTDIRVGDRAGSNREPENLLHEMAHFAEIEPERADTPGWGLSYYNQIYIPGRYSRIVYEPNTYEDIERECRVLSYQYCVAQHFNIPMDLVGMVSYLSFVPGFMNVPSIGYPVPQELNKESEWMRQAYPWIWRRVQQNLETYTKPRFDAEWKHRVYVLETYGASKRK